MPRPESALIARSGLLRDARNDPIWKLLAGYNAPEVLAILWFEYVYAGENQIPTGRLHEYVTDDVKILTRLGRDVEGTGSFYCSRWVQDGWLDRRPTGDGTEEIYELSSEAEAALLIVDRLAVPLPSATESKMAAIMTTVTNLAVATDPQRESRIAAITAERDRLNEQLAQLKAGVDEIDTLPEERALETVREVLSQAAQAGADFSRVRRHFGETVNTLRLAALNEDLSRGDVLEQILNQIDQLDATTHGRSFNAFCETLTDPTRIAQVEAALDAILSRPFSSKLTAAEQVGLRDMMTMLRHRATEARSVSDTLSGKLRSYIQENRFAQERRVGHLLNDAMRAYAALAHTHAGSIVVPYTMELPKAELGSIGKWRLATAERTLPPALVDDSDNVVIGWEELDFLADGTEIDFTVLREAIDATLDAQGGLATVGDVIRRAPLVDGLTELVGYLILAARGVNGTAPLASISGRTTEAVKWDGTRTATIPKIMFRSEDHA